MSATDNAGNPLKFDKVSVLGADKVDTHKVGDYSLTYSLKPISPIEKVVHVHVKSGALTLSSLPSIDFNNIILNGSSQTSKPKNRRYIIELAGSSRGYLMGGIYRQAI